MDKKELLIMSCLRQNARETLTNLSKKTHIPISTIYDKIKLQYKERNVIKKHTSIIDFSKIGFDTRANIMIKVEKDSKESFQEFIIKHHNVNSVFRINNGFDFLVEGIFKNMMQMETFMEEVDSKFDIKGKEVYYIIEDIKRENFMTDPQLIGLLF